MKQERTTSSFRRFFGSKLFVFVLTGIVFLLAINYGRALYQEYTIQQEIQHLNAEVKQLEDKKLESMKILQYVTSNAFVEEKARTELNMKKPGEQMALLQGGETTGYVKNQNFAEQSHLPVLLNNPLKWWYYIAYHSLPES